ncbi:glycosyltransferase family 4 protein [Candidatus Dependentiae bacterium]|nr:glycosyltransferase family 4 protein [Candidatus Dependentiae bacterium]MBU4387311.1 glycosyltransferase family 4 protein [Candidatus Dependentiae bacterium]MCG2756430.1 glycosyltransferase family 4 protein [Candidatus Dependentiae bacterium]
MKVVIAAGGRFHAFHLAHQLEKIGVLKRLYTGSYSDIDKKYVSKKFIINNNNFSRINFLFSKLRFYKYLNKSKLHRFQDNVFDNWLSKNILKEKEIDIFVGWANYFYKSLNNIKKTGAKIILESGSTHILEQQKLLNEEYETFGIKYSAINKKTLEKVLSEYDSADYIMSPSNFTKNSFLKYNIAENKLLNVPYGVDVDFFSKIKKQNIGKFRVIFVGLVCLRKGVQYLLQAWQKLNLPIDKTELLIVGNILSDINPFLKNIKLNKNVIFYGSTDKNNLSKLYSQSSLFVLPSIEEGLSMTIAEAMASGLPVICTTNTGGQDLIQNGVQGFISQIRDPDDLAEKILFCYTNKDLCNQMGLSGAQKVKNFTWDNYGHNIYKKYLDIMDNIKLENSI